MMDGGMSGPDGGADGGAEGGAGPGDASPTVVAKVCDLDNVTLLVSNTSGNEFMDQSTQMDNSDD